MRGEVVLDQLCIEIEWTIYIGEVKQDFGWTVRGALGVRDVCLHPSDLLDMPNRGTFMFYSSDTVVTNGAGDSGIRGHGRQMDVENKLRMRNRDVRKRTPFQYSNSDSVHVIHDHSREK